MPQSGPGAVLTARQRAALRALKTFQAEHGFPPTRAELGELLGVSAQTADFHLRALERKGVLAISGQARGIRAARAAGGAQKGGPAGPAGGQKGGSFSSSSSSSSRRRSRARFRDDEAISIPLLGRVAAGQPLLALENLEGRIPLPAGSGADFALRVEGDSMIEAGILDGDLVLVQQSATAEKGQIVVALIGEGETAEATVKRYLPGRNRVVLRPANAALADLVVRPGEGFALVGRVVGVLRLWH